MVNSSRFTRQRCPTVIVLLLWAVIGSGCTPSAQPGPTATASAPTSVADLDTAIEEYITAGSGNLENITAILVSVNGKLLTEHYRERGSAEQRTHVFSITKSVLSTLVGIAVAEGKITDLDRPLRSLLPRHTKHMSPKVAGITLRQLLTMSSGMPELGRDRFTNSAVRKFLELPLAADPGTTFIYSDASAELVAAVLTEAIDHPILEYARDKLFDPLDIETQPAYTGKESFVPSRHFDQAGFAWATTTDGINHGCCLLKLTARDMFKLGQLYLDNGLRNGKQILPADWVAQATTPSATSKDYGYLWWIGDTSGHPSYAAIGRDGQVILVVPDLRAVITVSAWSNPDMVLDETMVLSFIADVIIPRIS
jgi:CubicO group peptidase (beta-lactamase class C family)